MANFDNAATRQLEDEMRQRFDMGMADGYDANPNALPEWWFTVAPGHMTPYMRGWWFGREARQQEAKQG